MIIKVGKNCASLALEARHEPVNSIFLDAFCFLMLNKVRLQFRLQKVTEV